MKFLRCCWRICVVFDGAKTIICIQCLTLAPHTFPVEKHKFNATTCMHALPCMYALPCMHAHACMYGTNLHKPIHIIIIIYIIYYIMHTY